jgi:general secretion pathway protein G
VVVVVVLLITVALDRLLRYAEYAERAAMEQSISAMKSALGLRFAALYLRGRNDALQALPGENPMEWLAERPPGYVGELWDPPLEKLERPSWYYDRARGELVYVPLRTRYLVAAGKNDARIRFKVLVDFGPGKGTQGLPELRRLGIDPAEPYNWFQDLP